MKDEAYYAWIRQVRVVMSAHPEWEADTIAAMQDGVMDYIGRLNNQRANAETALLFCFEKARKKLTPAEYETCAKTIKESGMWAGTKFADEL